MLARYGKTNRQARRRSRTIHQDLLRQKPRSTRMPLSFFPRAMSSFTYGWCVHRPLPIASDLTAGCQAAATKTQYDLHRSHDPARRPPAASSGVSVPALRGAGDPLRLRHGCPRGPPRRRRGDRSRDRRRHRHGRASLELQVGLGPRHRLRTPRMARPPPAVADPRAGPDDRHRRRDRAGARHRRRHAWLGHSAPQRLRGPPGRRRRRARRGSTPGGRSRTR